MSGIHVNDSPNEVRVNPRDLNRVEVTEQPVHVEVSIGGPQGAQGTQGTQGTQGPQGTQGVQGFGYAQLQGTQGTQGTQGGPGLQGLQGLQGVQGLQGTQGVQGAQGLQGVQGPQGDKGGVRYNFSTTTTAADPGQGNIRFNNATFGSITQIYIDQLTVEGADVSNYIAQWSASTQSNKGWITIKSNTNGDSTHAMFTVSSGVVNNAGWLTIPVVPWAGSMPSASEPLVISFARSGDVGTQGIQGIQGSQGLQGTTGSQGTVGRDGNFGGATFDYTYDSSTANSDPGVGRLRFNSATITTATAMYIDASNDAATNLSSFLNTVDDSSSAVKGHFRVAKKFDASVFALLTITALSDNTGWFTVTGSYVSGNPGALANNDDVIVTFVRTGDQGDTGLQGSTGPQGVQGLTGTQGVQGLTGTQGLQGTQGVQGTQGLLNQYTVSETAPTVGVQTGDLWFRSSTAQLYLYYDGFWVETSSSYAGQQGLQGLQGTQGLQGLQGPATGSITVNSASPALTLNQTSSGRLLDLQTSATSRFFVTTSGLPYLNLGALTSIDFYTEAGSDMALSLPSDSWDDKLRWKYGLYETSANGTTAWTAGAFDSQVTDGRMDTFVSLPTASLGHRFTFFDSNFYFMSARFLRLSTGYANVASVVTVLYETSADNSTWTTRGTYTSIPASIMKRIFRLADSGADQYVRVTIIYTTVNNAVALENIELLTYRPGNQGGTMSGPESRLPIATWLSSRTPILIPTSTAQSALVVRGSPVLTAPINNAVGSGSVVTYTTAAPHNLRIGLFVVVTLVNPGAYNISGVVASTPSLNSFTISNAATGGYVSGGTVTANQTADLQQWQESNSGTPTYVSSIGGLRVRTYSNSFPFSALAVGAAAPTEIGVILRGSSSQTSDMLQVQDNTANVLGGFSATGRLLSGGSSATTVSNLLLGFSGAVNAAPQQLGVVSRELTTVGAVVRGAPSQSADLQQWQNSSGNVVARVASNGAVHAFQLVLTTGGLIGPGGATSMGPSTLRNVWLNAVGGTYGGGEAVTFIGNATVVPTSNPTLGGLLYVDNGDLEYRGPSGAVTPLSFTPVAAQTGWTGAVALSQAETMGTYLLRTLTGNVTVTVAAGVAGKNYSCTLELQQDSTGSRTIALLGVRTPYGVTLVLSTAALATDVVRLEWNGTFWTAFMGASAVSVPAAWV